MPANCISAAVGDLPLLCICDENCTVFAEDCCGPQHPGVAEGQVTDRSLVCASTTASCPAGGLMSVLFFEETCSIEIMVLVYNCQGDPLVWKHCIRWEASLLL